MRLFKLMSGLCLGALLAACGGGGGSAGISPFDPDQGGSSATAPSVVEVVASANTAGTDGGQVTITAVVKGAGNVTIPDAKVQFSTNSGTLADVASQTDANGAASASFSAGSDKSNRQALITVTAGGVSGSIAIAVTGTSLDYLGPTTLTLGGVAQEVSITARDAKGAAIAGAPLTVTSALGNLSAAAAVVTDASGVAKMSYTPSNAGADTLTVQGLGETKVQAVAVIGEDFSFTLPVVGTSANIGTPTPISVRYRVNGAVPAGAFTVRFTSTAGTLSATAVSLTGGSAGANVTSTFAGPATLQATLYADAAPTVVVAQATIAMSFIAITPDRLTLQVLRSAIGPNQSGSVAQETDVMASVVDAFSNPVANVMVNFSKVADPSGGTLSQPSAMTNNNGIAIVKYISGAQSTPTDGVVLKAVVPSYPVAEGQATLTVNQSALFIALGTGNEISNGDPANTTYLKVWTAYVTDATGAAVSNVTLTISALPKLYGKGSFKFVGTQWATQTVSEAAGPSYPNLLQGESITCASEDSLLGPTAPQTNNGVLDLGEDENGDGKLQPGNVISVNSGPSITTVKTDANGFAIINLRYAESYAYWVQVGLKASASVAGTESSNEAVFWAPGMSSDYSSATVAPAGAVSPFGIQASCKAPN